MTSSRRLVVTDDVDDDALQAVEDGLNRFNETQNAPAPTRSLLAKCIGENEEICGGAFALIQWDCLIITRLWVKEENRGRGIGAHLLRAIEHEAGSRGCTASRLMTMSFQAPAFYNKFGYEEECRVCDWPPGHDTIYMKKTLASA